MPSETKKKHNVLRERERENRFYTHLSGNDDGVQALLFGGSDEEFLGEGHPRVSELDPEVAAGNLVEVTNKVKQTKGMESNSWLLIRIPTMSDPESSMMPSMLSRPQGRRRHCRLLVV